MAEMFLNSMREFAGFCWSIFSYLGQLASVTIGDYFQYGFAGVGSNPFTDYQFDGLGSVPPSSFLFDMVTAIENILNVSLTDTTVFVFSLYVITAGFVVLIVARALTNIIGSFTPDE